MTHYALIHYELESEAPPPVQHYTLLSFFQLIKRMDGNYPTMHFNDEVMRQLLLEIFMVAKYILINSRPNVVYTAQ